MKFKKKLRYVNAKTGLPSGWVNDMARLMVAMTPHYSSLVRDIIPIQPMDGPSGQVFFLDFLDKK